MVTASYQRKVTGNFLYRVVETLRCSPGREVRLVDYPRGSIRRSGCIYHWRRMRRGEREGGSLFFKRAIYFPIFLSKNVNYSLLIRDWGYRKCVSTHSTADNIGSRQICRKREREGGNERGECHGKWLCFSKGGRCK